MSSQKLRRFNVIQTIVLILQLGDVHGSGIKIWNGQVAQNKKNVHIL